MSADPTRRFSAKVANYVAARPDYPQGVIDLLGEPSVVADVGAGTGILSRMLLNANWRVHAIEPNGPMGDAALTALGDNPSFTLHRARAEDTRLPDHSVDCITAAQAFHWFDPGPTRDEFVRIGRPRARVALIWNDRDDSHSPLLRGYEAIVDEFGSDYRRVHHRRVDNSVLDPFFGGSWQVVTMPHEHHLDQAGLRARLLSCSYIPGTESPRYTEMLTALDRLFQANAVNGIVSMPYQTRVCVGPID